jgi:hypothetical protein
VIVIDGMDAIEAITPGLTAAGAPGSTRSGTVIGPFGPTGCPMRPLTAAGGPPMGGTGTVGPSIEGTSRSG